MGEAIAAARAQRRGKLDHIAVIGLGTGALACHVGAGEDRDLLRDRSESGRGPREGPAAVPLPRRLRAAGAGGARRRAAHARPAQPKRQSDVIVVDAFSSDAIPVHLMTREAVALMQTKLAARGVLVFHISNRAMDFSGVLARVAADLGLIALFNSDRSVHPDDPDMRSPSIVMALMRDPADFGRLALATGEWKPVEPDLSARVWTDDYSTILDPLRAKLLAPSESAQKASLYRKSVKSTSFLSGYGLAVTLNAPCMADWPRACRGEGPPG